MCTRIIFKTILLGGVMAGLAFGSSTMAAQLRLAHFASSKHPLHTDIFLPWAQQLAEATNGSLKVEVHPAGQLGAGPAEQYNRVIDGVADITFGLQGYTSALFPKTLLIELPGVPRSSGQGTEGLWNAMPLIQDEYRRVKPLALFTGADAMIMTRNKPIRRPEDLKGLKIRVPSATTARAVAAWGAVPVSMPISELYNAAQTGSIDGALIDGSAIPGFRLGEVFNNFTVGVPPTNSVMFVLMNRRSYERLSSEEKAAIDSLSGLQLSKKANENQQAKHEQGLEAMRKMPGKTVIELTPEQKAAFAKLSSNVVDQVVADMEKRGVKNASKIVEAMGERYNP
jgi:TRAP-type C4-dicarboxylate transport system substrate-binding protein